MSNEKSKKYYEDLAEEIYTVALPRTNPDLTKAYVMGMIPKRELYHGKKYIGACRNTKEATWDSMKQKFLYQRHKFGGLIDAATSHPEDDAMFDVFVPVFQID
jgi:hypothetical protein